MPSMVRWCLVAVSAAGLVGAVVAQNGANPANQFRELFDQLDMNHDRNVERTEVPEANRAAFDKLLARGDKNHDGKLSGEEYRVILMDLGEFARVARDQAVKRFDGMDTDHDKKLTRTEFTGPAARFDVLDRDKDGTVTREEFFGNAAAAAKKALAKANGKAAVKKPAVAKKKAGALVARLLEQFAQLDKDNDGSLSRTEFPGTEQQFDRIDIDFDGRLSKKEVERVVELVKSVE